MEGEVIEVDVAHHASGIYGINTLRNASFWISRGAWRTSMISPLTFSMQISGFLSTIEGIDQSGSIGYMPKRRRDAKQASTLNVVLVANSKIEFEL